MFSTKIYHHVVPLGSFCSPALELRRIGVRTASLPFDWLITPKMADILILMKNGFEDFLSPQHMYQFKDYPKYYKNKKYNIDFYHDFDPYKSFDKQIDSVLQKYQRRTERFYSYIQEPTLFIRYITSQEDADDISKNYQEILGYLQSFHQENDIIFFANKGLKVANELMTVIFVEKDKEDSVARTFLLKAPEMEEYILNHIAFAPVILPTNTKKSVISRGRNFIKKFYGKFRKTYCHVQRI